MFITNEVTLLTSVVPCFCSTNASIVSLETKLKACPELATKTALAHLDQFGLGISITDLFTRFSSFQAFCGEF